MGSAVGREYHVHAGANAGDESLAEWHGASRVVTQHVHDRTREDAMAKVIELHGGTEAVA